MALQSYMSEKYKVNMNTTLHHHAHGKKVVQQGASGQQMNKVTDTLLDVTKVAVVGGVAMGLLGATGALIKK